MAGTLTAIGEQRALDWLFTTGTPTRPIIWYLALHVGANGGAGASNELVGNGYARQVVTLTRANNVISNSALVSFGPNITSSWGTVTDITLWDASSAGNCLAQGTATSAIAYVLGDTATIAIGAFTVTLT